MIIAVLLVVEVIHLGDKVRGKSNSSKVYYLIFFQTISWIAQQSSEIRRNDEMDEKKSREITYHDMHFILNNHFYLKPTFFSILKTSRTT